jgi:hypothetical protein
MARPLGEAFCGLPGKKGPAGALRRRGKCWEETPIWGLPKERNYSWHEMNPSGVPCVTVRTLRRSAGRVADHIGTRRGRRKHHDDTERTMSTTSTYAVRRRLLPWTAVGLSIVASFATGHWTAKSMASAANPPQAVAAATMNPVVAEVAPPTFPIIPSPVIETNPQFFYGTGDGNGSYNQDR